MHHLPRAPGFPSKPVRPRSTPSLEQVSSHHPNPSNRAFLRTSLVIQWLRLQAFNARDKGSIPGQRTKIPFCWKVLPPPTAPQNRSFLDVSLSLTPQAHSHLHSITKPCPLYLESVCVSPHPLPLSYSKPPASPSPTVWPPHLGHLCPSKPFSTQKPEWSLPKIKKVDISFSCSRPSSGLRESFFCEGV